MEEMKPQIQIQRLKLGNQGLEALKELPNEKVQLATKFGITYIGDGKYGVNGTPEYIRECCDASLKRLGVDYTDLYYQHRVDPSVPIEDTIGGGAQKFSGRRELGIGIVAYSPLGRGFFGGKAIVESSPKGSILAAHPRFAGENLDRNKLLYAHVANLAAKHSCTPPQLALAWVLHQGDDIVPIPGTTKMKNLENNIGSLEVKLSAEDLEEVSDAVPIEEVSGERDYEVFSHYNWESVTTPPKKM